MQMLKKYIQNYCADCGIGELNLGTEEDRFSLMITLDNGSSEAVIFDNHELCNEWVITLMFESERKKSRTWLLKLLEWNYDNSEQLPGIFGYDNFSGAITLKKRLQSNNLTYQQFYSVLQKLLAHANFRRGQLVHLEKPLAKDAEIINAKQIVNSSIQTILFT